MGARLRSLRDEWRPAAITRGAPFLPLAILFGLNAVDELDRTAFSVLIPEIRDHFGLDNQAILTIVALSSVTVILLEIPIAHFADRRSRVRIAGIGAAAWAVFSVFTGLALTIGMLIAARLGSGIGRSVVEPTHNSLLADYYEPEARTKVFGFHRLANSVGQILGPLTAGVLAWIFDWRVPFIVLAIPTALLVSQTFRLKDPVRGAHERRAAGGDAVADIESTPAGFIESFRVLGRVRTLRRIWLAVPFLGVTLFGVPTLLSIIYDEVFGVTEIGRGAIAAAAEPAQIVGIGLAIPLASRLINRDPRLVLRLIALVGVANGIMLGVLAYAPNLGVAVFCNLFVSGTVGILAPIVFASLSLLLPPRSRSMGFSILPLFAVPGILVVLPLVGWLADTYGAQPAMLVMTPLSIVSGTILAWAGNSAPADIDKIRAEAVAEVTPTT